MGKHNFLTDDAQVTESPEARLTLYATKQIQNNN